jgi:hypothetical protein
MVEITILVVAEETTDPMAVAMVIRNRFGNRIIAKAE